MSADERDLLAAEYVLGIAEADRVAICERLLREDTTFAPLVETWRARFSELDWTAVPEPTGHELWSRIQSGLQAPEKAGFREQTRTQEAIDTPLRGDGGVASALAQAWRSLGLWRGFGLAATAACLTLAVALASLLAERSSTPIFVTIMAPDGNGRPAAIVNTFRDGRNELVPLSAVNVPKGRTLQVWTLWDREKGPVSVGLIDSMKSIDLVVNGLPPARADQLFEITLEPEGGSPTGRPTGPILMKGNAMRTL